MEREPPEDHRSIQQLQKILLQLEKLVELTIRSVAFPATIGLFSPPEKSDSDVLIRLSFDVASWMLIFTLLQEAQEAEWDKPSIIVLAAFFLIAKTMGVPVIEHIARDK